VRQQAAVRGHLDAEVAEAVDDLEELAAEARRRGGEPRERRGGMGERQREVGGLAGSGSVPGRAGVEVGVGAEAGAAVEVFLGRVEVVVEAEAVASVVVEGLGVVEVVVWVERAPARRDAASPGASSASSEKMTRQWCSL
jgi:hypothetical protein